MGRISSVPAQRQGYPIAAAAIYPLLNSASPQPEHGRPNPVVIMYADFRLNVMQLFRAVIAEKERASVPMAASRMKHVAKAVVWEILIS